MTPRATLSYDTWVYQLLSSFQGFAFHILQQTLVPFEADIKIASESTLQIPVIENPKKVEARTRLVVLDDMNLIKISKSLKEAGAQGNAPAPGKK